MPSETDYRYPWALTLHTGNGHNPAVKWAAHPWWLCAPLVVMRACTPSPDGHACMHTLRTPLV